MIACSSLIVQCGVDVATLEYKDFVSADYNLHMLEPEQVLPLFFEPDAAPTSAYYLSYSPSLPLSTAAHFGWWS